MIEDVSESIRAWDVEHHVVHFYEKDGVLLCRAADLPENCYSRERNDALLKQQLESAVQGELLAHFRYLMFAERARRRGMEHIAQVFQALAASEYYHARSFFSVLEQPAPFKEAAKAFQDDPFIQNVLGEDLSKKYLRAKQKEYAEYSSQVTQWEISRYLQRI